MMKRISACLIWSLLLVLALLPGSALAESSILDMEAAGNSVYVEWKSTEDALLVVEIVKDGQNEPYAIEKTVVSGKDGYGEEKFTFDSMPAYFSIEAYFSPVSGGTGGEGSGTVFVEDLYTKPVQQLIRSDGSEYEAQYGDHYLELFIDGNGKKSFGVLRDEYTVLRTADLKGNVSILRTDTDHNGVPEAITVTTTDASADAAWLQELSQLAEGAPAYLCIVDDKDRELLDYRKLSDGDSPAAEDVVQFHMMYLDTAEQVNGGLRLLATDEPAQMRRSSMSWIEKLLEHFNILRLDSTWDKKNQQVSGSGYAVDFDIKGSISIQSVLTSARRIEISNDFNFRKIELDGGQVKQYIPIYFIDPSIVNIGYSVYLNFLLEFEGGQHVSASMSGNMKNTFNLKGQNGGTRIDHMKFLTDEMDNAGAPQTMTIKMGPELEVSAGIYMAKATLSGEAFTTVELVQGQSGDETVWHACGSECVEGFPEHQQKLKLIGHLNYLLGSLKIVDWEIGHTEPQKAVEFYHSEKFNTSGEGLCPYKGYKTTVWLLDAHNQPVEMDRCFYTPVRPELLEKAASAETPGVLYIPASNEPVTVQVTYTTPGGTQRTLSRQIVKTAEAGEVIFRLEEEEYWLIYDSDGEPVSNMPEAVSCRHDDIFLISEQIPVCLGRKFSGWSFKPKSDPGRQVDYRPGNPFWMTHELFGESNSVTLYPVWEGDSYLYYTVKPEDLGKVKNIPPVGVNQTVISPIIPQRGENDYFIGWMDDSSIIPHLPLMPNPYYPESGTLTAQFVNTDALYPTLTFEKGNHADGYVVNMPKNIEEGIIAGVPFKLPSEIPFLIELDFWSVDIPQFFVGWSLFENSKIPTFFPGMDFVALTDTTLYAVWVDRPDFYLLSYHANGGSGAPRTGFNAKKISATAPARPGHEFVGWVKKADLKEDNTPKWDAEIYAPGSENPFYEEMEEDGKTVRSYRSGTLYAVWKASSGVYTVSFDANGGTDAPDSVTGSKGSALRIPAQLPKSASGQASAQFAGWGDSADNPASVYQPGGSYTGSKDITLYAQWKTGEMTVYYDANGGDADSVPEKQSFAPDEENKILSDVRPVRTGYRFEGWSADPDARYAQYQPGSRYAGQQSVVLYAVWTPDETEIGVITYDANGGEHAPQPQHAAFGRETTLSEQIPIRENYIFVGWANDPGAKQANHQPGDEYLFAGDVTFYAVWALNEARALTVTYNANGGEPGSVPEKQTFDADEENKLLSSEKPVRSGYRFAGWAADANAQAAQYQPGSRYDGTESIVLYAIWTANEGCTVTYDANGGTNAPQPQAASLHETVRLSMDVPVRENHIFMGWALAADAAEDEYQPGDSYTCTADVTLYAVWSRDAYRIYTVSYDANGGDEESVPPAESAFKGEMIMLSEHIPTRYRYLFKGWSADPDAETASFQPGDMFTASSDTTLYAVWQLNPAVMFSVTYHVNGGSGAPEGQSGFVGDPVTLSEVQPVRTHYAFMGWALSATADKAEFAPGQRCFVNGNVTFYAVWKKDLTKERTVTYHANGGDEASVPAAQTVLLGEAVTVPDQKPVRDRYVFMGWALSATAEAAQLHMGETFICTENLDLYAVWSEDYTQMYTVSYSANGGTDAPAAQMAFNDQQICLSGQKPRREGHAFLGWAADPEAEEAAFQPGDMFPGASAQQPYTSAVLYAVWESGADKIYTVTYDANGGSGAPEPQSELNTVQIRLSDAQLEWRDYTFLGWSEDPQAAFASYLPGDKFPAGQAPYTDAVLYAVWDKDPWYYVVTYDANGGNGAPEPQYALISQNMRLTEVQPERDAYVFLGWAEAPQAAAAAYLPGAEFTKKKDTTLYAVWEDDLAGVYTVVYDANGGDPDSVPQPQSAYVGDSICLTTLKPSKENCAFAGWALSADALQAQYQPGDAYTRDVSGTVTLYALWESDPEKTYTVTYYANGSNARIPSSQTEKRGTPIQLSPMTPVDTAWRFMGWATESNSMRIRYWPGNMFPADQSNASLYRDTALYAVWDKDDDGVYTVTYDANGGTGAPKAHSAFVGYTMLVSDGVPVREGYVFQGWATEPDAAQAKYQGRDLFPGNTEDELADIALYRDTTLYAVWKKDPAKVYTITYNLNGGTGAFAPQSAIIGSSVRLHAHKPEHGTNVFAGWALDANAAAVALQPGALCSFTRDIVLYAVWEAPRYTVAYDANGGKGAPDPQSAPAGTSITLHDESRNPVRSGFSFLGWAASPLAQSAQYQPGGSYTGYADITLYAVWAAQQGKTYTVTYHANGGDPASVPQPQSAPEGEPLTLSLQRPVYPEHTFIGWARSANSAAADFQPGQYYSECKPMDLWALWTAQQRTILFDDNGGAHGPGSQSFSGETVTVVQVIPVRPGYRFEGWALSASQPQTVCAVPGGRFAWPEGNTDMQLTLYAVWTQETGPLPKLPDTGDRAAPVLWLAMMMLSGAGAVLMRACRKRIRN